MPIGPEQAWKDTNAILRYHEPKIYRERGKLGRWVFTPCPYPPTLEIVAEQEAQVAEWMRLGAGVS